METCQLLYLPSSISSTSSLEEKDSSSHNSSMSSCSSTSKLSRGSKILHEGIELCGIGYPMCLRRTHGDVIPCFDKRRGGAIFNVI